MGNFSSPITCNTRIFTAIFNHDMTDIHMAYYVTMHSYILTDEKSTIETQIHIKSYEILVYENYANIVQLGVSDFSYVTFL